MAAFGLGSSSDSLSVLLVVAFILVAIAVLGSLFVKRDSKKPSGGKSGTSDGLVPCPMCLELIQRGAVKCKHCGSMLNADGPSGAVAEPHATPAATSVAASGQSPIESPVTRASRLRTALMIGAIVLALPVAALSIGAINAAKVVDLPPYVDAVIGDSRVAGLFEGSDAYDFTTEVVEVPESSGYPCVIRMHYKYQLPTGEVDDRKYIDFTVVEVSEGDFVLANTVVDQDGREFPF